MMIALKVLFFIYLAQYVWRENKANSCKSEWQTIGIYQLLRDSVP